MVSNNNLYCPLLVAGQQPRVAYGATVNGCVVKPRTMCRNAQLAGAMLRGGLFDYANLSGADMSGATLALAAFTDAQLAGTDMSHTTLIEVRGRISPAQRSAMR